MEETNAVILDEYSSTSDSDLDEDSISTINESESSFHYSTYEMSEPEINTE